MFGIIFEGNRDLRRIYMPPDYQSFPLRKDFYLADDAARSPGGGVRPMERTHAPTAAPVDGARPPVAGVTEDRSMTTTTRAPLRSTTRGSRSTASWASSSRSRRTRRAPSARPSSTRSATARCSSTWARSTRRPTACSGSCSSSTARRSSTSTRSSATSTAASRSCARTPTTTRPSATLDPLEYVSSLFYEWAPGHGVREAARRPGAAPRRVHPGPRRPSSTGSPATRCSSAGWRSTSAG